MRFARGVALRFRSDSVPRMPSDRATYLARTLIARMRNLAVVDLDSSSAEKPRPGSRREEQVAKVLAVEAGIVDGATVQWVASAIPTIDLRRESTEREVSELADFLRRQLNELG